MKPEESRKQSLTGYVLTTAEEALVLEMDRREYPVEMIVFVLELLETEQQREETAQWLAEANVKAATGKEMKTQEEAMSWLESRTEEAIRKAQSEVDANGGDANQATTEGK